MRAHQRPQSARRSRPSSASGQRQSAPTSATSSTHDDVNSVAGDLHSANSNYIRRTNSAGSGIRASRALRRSASAAGRNRRSVGVASTDDNPISSTLNAERNNSNANNNKTTACSWEDYIERENVGGMLETLTNDVVDHITNIRHLSASQDITNWIVGHMERYARSSRSLNQDEARMHQALYHLCLINLESVEQAEEDVMCAFDALVSRDDNNNNGNSNSKTSNYNNSSINNNGGNNHKNNNNNSNSGSGASFDIDVSSTDNLLHPQTVRALITSYCREKRLPLVTSQKLLRRITRSNETLQHTVYAVSANHFAATVFVAVSVAQLVDSLRSVFAAAEIEQGIGRVESDTLIDVMRSNMWPCVNMDGMDVKEREISGLAGTLVEKQDEFGRVSESEFVHVSMEWLNLV